MNPIPKHGIIPSLDGWRAVAIILVLGDHFAYTDGFPNYQYGWINRIFDGNLGVRIFFVLSGFLISLLLIREADQHNGVSLKDFYIRRVFRIFPIYFAYLGVLAALTLAGLYSDKLSSWLGCLTFTRNMVGVGQSATVHFWSLAVEEQFYLLWPILFTLLQLWKRPNIYIAILFIPILICPIIRAYFVTNPMETTIFDRFFGERSILIYADSLAVGCLGAWWASRLPTDGTWRSYHNILIVMALLFVIAGRYCQLFPFPDWQRICDALIPSIQAWSCLALLWLTGCPSALGYRILNSRPMNTLGKLSYSVYVWHFLFISHFIGDRLGHWPIYSWKFWIFPALITSTVSYYCLEKPVMRLRSKFRHQT